MLTTIKRSKKSLKIPCSVFNRLSVDEVGNSLGILRDHAMLYEVGNSLGVTYFSGIRARFLNSILTYNLNIFPS